MSTVRQEHELGLSAAAPQALVSTTFDLSVPGRKAYSLPECDVPAQALDKVFPARLLRSRPAAAGDGFLPEGMTLDEYEQSLIREALKRANGNKSQAARLLGLTRNALRYRLSQMGIE